MTSPKLEALRTSLSKAIDARHEREIEDDIRREEEHLRTCPFAKQAAAHNTIVHDLQAQLSDATEAHGNVLAKIAEAAGSKCADQPERLILEVRLNRMHLTTYMEKLNRADLFEIAVTDLLGLPQHSGQEAILKTIRDLKTAESRACHDAAHLTGLAIDRGDALDRLLTILKAPLHYDGGESLTREERIEWAIRRAPKT